MKKYFYSGEWYTDKEDRVKHKTLAVKLSKQNYKLELEYDRLNKALKKCSKQQDKIDEKLRELVIWPEIRYVEEYEKVAH